MKMYHVGNSNLRSKELVEIDLKICTCFGDTLSETKLCHSNIKKKNNNNAGGWQGRAMKRRSGWKTFK